MILGIDFGEAHIGLALSEGELAEPFGTIKTSQTDQIGRICEENKVTLIVVGISEGKSAENAHDFGNKLSDVLRLPVKFVDETLSTIEAGEGKGDHERAAAIILQRYLDDKINNA